MEVATLQTWLMLSNKPRRKSSSQIGGKRQQYLDLVKQKVGPFKFFATYEVYVVYMSNVKIDVSFLSG